ncbi:1-aminocyclopropane-1-carboxylate deaminase [Thalassotalea loyana]|uniref:1-aminocyclopropane-1-carboxylate deaminase n=1 Tax=Thalassotalea loyana TaxID=280483 RepID=A0ABQ6H7U7_9GAMM|nr:pyridoxal-phosphate dependent enzyme [Thalassotalea loyana]GLX84207.1 1-aminocyclopropane-1-carboxylate deaminase [Thalassotalea loyana]
MSTPSPITPLHHPLFEQANISVCIKRDDQIHPIISGNKWRKLKGNVELALQQGKKGIVSFGGAYSNHIHALSYACKINGLSSVGIIRGEQHFQENATLSQAKSWGMNLQFVDRATYKLRHDEAFLIQVRDNYPDHLIVPEGGTNDAALTGVGEVMDELETQLEFDTIITPVGSAGTIAGLIKSDKNKHNIVGISVLKGAQYLEDEVKKLIQDDTNQTTNWEILHDFHLGGYAKFSTRDIQHLAQLNKQLGVMFEPIYSGKMLLAFISLVEQGYFSSGERVVLLHTGGLQGINGMLERNILPSSQWPWQLVQ